MSHSPLYRIAFLVVLTGMLLVIQPSLAAPPAPPARPALPTLYLNQLPLLEIPPVFTESNQFFIPVQVAQNLGAKLELDQANHTARLVLKDKFFYLKEGSKHVLWSQTGLQIALAPIWQNETLYAPLSFFINLGAMAKVSTADNKIFLQKSLNTIKTLRMIPQASYTRVEFNFAEFPVYYLNETEKIITVELLGTHVSEPEQLLTPVQDVLLQTVQITPLSMGRLRVQIIKRYPTPHKLFWFEKPDKLTVDLIKFFKEEKTSQLDVGIQYRKTYQGFSFGPLSYHTVVIPANQGYQLAPAVATSPQGFTKEPTSRMAQRQNAIVAINAGYFRQDGLPLGLLVQNREMVASPLYNRTALLITDKQRLVMSPINALAAVEFPQIKQRKAFHGVNFPRQPTQFSLFTPRYGATTGTQKKDEDPLPSLELTISSDGTVEHMQAYNSAIPTDGWVISAHGATAQWLQQTIKIGMRALIYSTLTEQWPTAVHMIGGGPRLLQEGQITVTAETEKFQPDIAKGRAPRTAIGVRPDQSLVLFVADGRQERSYGLTLAELANMMREQGAIEAMNFDGGGSSTLFIDGQVVNMPSDHAERPVASGLLLLRR